MPESWLEWLRALRKISELRISIVLLVGAWIAALQYTFTSAHSHMVRCLNYDAASYYAIARNVALGRGLRDPILWNFLAAPEAVWRPAGDYWSVGWPVVLGLLMKLFGHSLEQATRISAAFSCLVPVMTFLVAKAMARNFSTAVLAALLVALNSILIGGFATPDMAMSHQLILLLAAWCFFWAGKAPWNHHRTWIAGFMGSLLIWFRGEGIIIPLATFTIAVLLRLNWLRGPAISLRWLLLGILLGVLPAWGYNWFSFGHLTPKPRAATALMLYYNQLFEFGAPITFERWFSQGYAQLWAIRRGALSSHLNALMSFAGMPMALCALFAAGRAALVRDAQRLLLVGYIFVGWFCVLMVSPVVAGTNRFCSSVTPLVSILAALFFEDFWAAIQALGNNPITLTRGVPKYGLHALPVSWERGGTLSVFALAIIFLYLCGDRTWTWDAGWQDRSQNWWLGMQNVPANSELRGNVAELQLKPTDLIISYDPWAHAALLDVRAVNVPRNGVEALEAVIKTYKPNYALAYLGSALEAFAEKHLQTAVTKLQGPQFAPALRTADGVWYRITYAD